MYVDKYSRIPLKTINKKLRTLAEDIYIAPNLVYLCIGHINTTILTEFRMSVIVKKVEVATNNRVRFQLFIQNSLKY